jgi:hypothetical protein
VIGAPAKQPLNQLLSGILGARSAIIHRTVRSATGLSGETAEQQLSARQRSPTAMNSACQKSEGTGLSRVAPDYPV